ncbi:Collagen triple helix repeat [Trinorchestia longiramus]|nr:Collagen triple helix repeat [Trinorchestia longiramus]
MRKLSTRQFVGIALVHVGCYFIWFRQPGISEKIPENSSRAASYASVLIDIEGHSSFEKNFSQPNVDETFVRPSLNSIRDDEETPGRQKVHKSNVEGDYMDAYPDSEDDYHNKVPMHKCISRDDRPYVDDTEVFVINQEDSGNDLKFLYPLKITVAVLTYGLIGCLAYVIHFMPLEGPRGPKGEKGWEGWKGYHGMRGIHGNKGEQGDIGRNGFIGKLGMMGSQGIKGSKGHPGDRGPKGIKGSKGKQGKKGHKGKPGDVSEGEIGSKGMQGLPGPMGNDGYEINIQGKKPHKKKHVVKEEKTVIHRHKHHHHHDHSHEHQHNSNIQLAVHTKSPIESEEEETAALRESGVFTHHVLLGENEAVDIENLTSEEILTLINSQLTLGENSAASVEVLNDQRGRVLMIHSNFSEDEMGDFKSYDDDMRDANSSLNIFRFRNLSAEKPETNSSHIQKSNNNMKINETWRKNQDSQIVHEKGEPYLYGDTAPLQSRNDHQYDAYVDVNSLRETNTESSIFNVPRTQILSSLHSKGHLLSSRENADPNTKSRTKATEFEGWNVGKEMSVRRRRNIKGELLQPLQQEHKIAMGETNMMSRIEAKRREKLLCSVNALWRESKTPHGCLHCVLFQSLVEELAISLDSYIM